MVVGILALQGDVREHQHILDVLNERSILVRSPDHLKECSALIIPGGESTTIRKLLALTKLDKAIIEFAEKQKPILGTCAGAILLAKEIEGNPFNPLGSVDITVKRNAYGAQTESFEDTVTINNKEVHVAFIRAPQITRVGKDVQVLAKHNNQPVLVKQGNIFLATFHPELCNETRVHELFLNSF